jgi:hypothetical protein
LGCSGGSHCRTWPRALTIDRRSGCPKLTCLASGRRSDWRSCTWRQTRRSGTYHAGCSSPNRSDRAGSSVHRSRSRPCVRSSLSSWTNRRHTRPRCRSVHRWSRDTLRRSSRSNGPDRRTCRHCRSRTSVYDNRTWSWRSSRRRSAWSGSRASCHCRRWSNDTARSRGIRTTE